MFVCVRSVSLKSVRLGSRLSRPRYIRGFVVIAALAAGLALPARRSRTRSPSPPPPTPWSPTAVAPSARPSSTRTTTRRRGPIAPPAPAPTPSSCRPAPSRSRSRTPARPPCRPTRTQQSAWGDLDILSSMTITGDPSGTTIDGAQLDRIFDINPDVDSLPETVTPVIAVQINDLTMTNARQNQSGAVRIQARATVAMDRCTVSNSTSWADDGGGIYRLRRSGALTLTNSTISGNHALIMGGGIRSDGPLNIVNSTITDNDTGAVFGNLAQGLMCGRPRVHAAQLHRRRQWRGAARRHRRHDHQPRLQHHRQDHQQPRRRDRPHHRHHRRSVRHRRGGGGPAAAGQQRRPDADACAGSRQHRDRQGREQPRDHGSARRAASVRPGRHRQRRPAATAPTSARSKCRARACAERRPGCRRRCGDVRGQQRPSHHRRAGQRYRPRFGRADHHGGDAGRARLRRQQRHLRVATPRTRTSSGPTRSPTPSTTGICIPTPRPSRSP